MKYNLKKAPLLILVLALTLMMVACSGNTPEDVAEDLMKTIKDQDTDKFKDMISEITTENFEKLGKLTGGDLNQLCNDFLASSKGSLDSKFGDDWYNKMTYEETINKDDKATVKITFDDDADDNDVEFNFIKEDDQWKLLLE